ncbi:hypothetical protein BK709_04325 [Bacillus thuringiensis serovar shandongiensis]|uniref:hypothetical protein n=1 Tax=Bacillus toyonensis TaxID=155322 RepID=UPI000B4536DD|nr:hypothetical protein [Bacillus toyonensis]MEC2394913.1 hypothetical protein [Bacillus toyonensis]OTX35785.1 hypothetical protein BK717_13615 [Bacillus thuringiensis serovar malayensis]OUB10935.1 hypothetical protein BK709_04325 [Bacillus thuringiensis serovar shandongiensis]
MNQDVYYQNSNELLLDREGIPMLSIEELYPATQPSTKEKNISCDIPFCCVIKIPPGFEYFSQGKNKMVYSLDKIAVINENCMKTIDVDQMGPVEVNLNLLKVVGSIPFVVNAEVKGEYGIPCDTSTDPQNHILISSSDTICVNNIIKISAGELPFYEVDGHNVFISTFHVTPVHEDGYHFVRFAGTLTFHNIPK